MLKLEKDISGAVLAGGEEDGSVTPRAGSGW